MESPIFEKYVKNAKRVFSKLSHEEIDRMNLEGIRSTDESYQRFQDAFHEGRCYLCGSPIKSFSVKNPCLHWLLRPKGLKKKHFKEFWGLFGYFRMETYLRWVANSDVPLKGINDLDFEKNDKKLIETTVRYKHYEWSFSCSKSDLEGHANAHEGNYPHFHFQMRLDKHQFINYSENHITFSDEDLWKLAMLNQDEIPFKHEFRYGEGMQSLLSEENVERVIDISEIAESEEDAAFEMSTTVMARPGETISGDDIADLIEESKRTGVPLAKLLRRLDASVSTVVTPGKGVPEIASRSKTKRNS